MPRIAQAICNGCGECIVHCPTGALGWQEGKAVLLQPDKCIYCATCETLCPVSAIELPYLVLKSSP
jgi:NAD-dependent dihydropyrimidine dehydrogenase PreA subunit